MGYETKLLIGKSCLHGPERKLGPDNELIPTGRHQAWFQIYAEIDLCKWGYDHDDFNALMQKTIKDGKEKENTDARYCYGLDGNIEFRVDRYGQPLYPAPIADVLEALQKSGNNDYRRKAWAVALLTEMAKDKEGIEVIFYGH